MIGNKTRKSGFTLIEMLITVTIFSLLAVVLAQIFVSFNRMHRRVASTATLGQDARFVTESLVRLARNNQIEYAAYQNGEVQPKESAIRLVSRDGLQHTIVAVRGPNDPACEDVAVRCLAVSVDGGNVWNAMTSRHVDVGQFDVFMRPSTDPFVPSALSDIQPMTTFVLGLEYLAPNSKDRSNLQVQTTVSSRIYLK